jgi:hypothetical protein
MLNWLFKKAEAANTSAPIIGLAFRNVKATKLLLWIEPYCIELALEPATEYRIETSVTEYLLEFSGEYITLCLNSGGSGPKVLKRPYSLGFENKNPWEVDYDYADL